MIQIRSLIIAHARGTPPGYLSPSLPLHFRAGLLRAPAPPVSAVPSIPHITVTGNGDAQGPSHCPSRRR